MKKVILNFMVLLIIVFFSCNSNEKESIFKEYINSANTTIRLINQQNKTILNELELEMRDLFYGNPPRIEPWYKKMENIKKEADFIIQRIDSFENILDKKNILTKHDILSLKSDFERFRKFSYIIIGNDSILYKPLIESINANLNTGNWNKVPCLSGNKTSLIETLAVLSKLKMDVRITETDLMIYIYSHISVCSFRFFRVAPIIEPSTQTIFKGKPYLANIFLGIMDTVINQTIEIEGTKYPIRYGKVFYKEKVSSKDFQVRRIGHITLWNTHIRKPEKTSFQLEYEVIK